MSTVRRHQHPVRTPSPFCGRPDGELGLPGGSNAAAHASMWAVNGGTTPCDSILAPAATARPPSDRGGGHSPGFGTVDDGLVIDLGQIRYARVDPDAKTARVGGGTTLGDLDHATHAFGLAAPGRTVSTTGATYDPENLFHLNQNIRPA